MPPSACSNCPARRRSAPVKAPLLVAEQFALEQRLGKGRAVHRDERPRRRARRGVDGARDQLLARAAFADDEHRPRDGGHPRDRAAAPRADLAATRRPAGSARARSAGAAGSARAGPRLRSTQRDVRRTLPEQRRHPLAQPVAADQEVGGARLHGRRRPAARRPARRRPPPARSPSTPGSARMIVHARRPAVAVGNGTTHEIDRRPTGQAAHHRGRSATASMPPGRLRHGRAQAPRGATPAVRAGGTSREPACLLGI